MLTLASPVLGLAPAIAPTPHADTFFGSASTATAGHWSGVAREAVLSGDRRVVRLDGLFSPSEAAALLAAARDTTFDEENDTVDDAATFLSPLGPSSLLIRSVNRKQELDWTGLNWAEN